MVMYGCCGMKSSVDGELCSQPREPGGAFGAPRVLSGNTAAASYPVGAIVNGTLVAAWVEGDPSDRGSWCKEFRSAKALRHNNVPQR